MFNLSGNTDITEINTLENTTINNREGLNRIAELEHQLLEAKNLIYAIRHGEVDALLLNKDGKADVYSLENIDYTYRVLIEKFAEGALSISNEGLILYCNSYFSELINLPISKIVGSYFSSYFSDHEIYLKLLTDIKEGVYKGEILLAIKEKRIPVYISITSLAPNLPGFGIILNDLTDKKKSEQIILDHQQQLEEKIEELNHHEKKLSQANKALLLQNEEKEKQAAELIAANTELTFMIGEKRKRMAELNIAYTDVKEQTEAKNKAEAATLIAEESVKAKQQFLANMSHEIRTPMNAIIGFTNVVLKTKLDKDQLEYINAIKISGDALIILINDILDLAKVNAGKMTFEQAPFHLSDSISTMLHLFEARIKEKNLELVHDYDQAIPRLLMGDPMRLRQIILNLASNAIKFTSEGKISLRIQLLEEDAERATVKFELSDTGIGIPENKLENIFNNFEQAHLNTSNSYGGTGLGLAIVKQLVELQGGTVFVNSITGEGSTFGFILTFDKANAEIEKEIVPDLKYIANSAIAETLIDNVKVLVAEDLPLNQLLIKIILAEFGFDLDIAGNGKIAIEKLRQNKYDIVLMDLQMPEMNGFDATEYIRKQLDSQIPIIALTADVTSIDVERCKTVGMNDYISKPIDEKLLYSKMVKYLRK
ncbi:MAG TPA: ATP-binding protein [Bacteroidia bacterium]|jgi:signal transduction histidine kinase/PAS domain-containing protein